MSEIRKTVSKKIIDKISPIERADFLEVATIGTKNVQISKKISQKRSDVGQNI